MCGRKPCFVFGGIIMTMCELDKALTEEFCKTVEKMDKVDDASIMKLAMIGGVLNTVWHPTIQQHVPHSKNPVTRGRNPHTGYGGGDGDGLGSSI